MINDLDIESKRALHRAKNVFDIAYKTAVEVLVGNTFRQIVGNVNRIANSTAFGNRSQRGGCFVSNVDENGGCDGLWIVGEMRRMSEVVDEMYARVGEVNLEDAFNAGVEKRCIQSSVLP